MENNTVNNGGTGSGSGLIIGIIIAIVLIGLFLAYGWPGFYRADTDNHDGGSADVHVDVPVGGTTGGGAPSGGGSTGGGY